MGDTTVTRILGSHFYLGEVQCDDQWLPGAHDCRIDPKLWQAAQRPSNGKPGPAPKDFVYLLDGLVVTSHYRVTYPEKQAGSACPLYTRYVRNRHGTLYFMYVRADKLRKHGGVQVEAADELAARLPPYIRADQLDERVVGWLTDKANQPQLQSAIQEALEDVLSRRGKVSKQRETLQKQLQSAEAKNERLKRRAVEIVMNEQPALLAAVNEELERSSEAIAELATRLADLGAAQKRLDDAALDANQAEDHIALIRKAWKQGKRSALRDLLRDLIKRVEVRVDRLDVWIYALPKMRVYELGHKVAPTGLIRIPGENRRIRWQAA